MRNAFLLGTIGFVAAAFMLSACSAESMKGEMEDRLLVSYSIDRSSYATEVDTTPSEVSLSIGEALVIEATVVMPDAIDLCEISASPINLSETSGQTASLLLGAQDFNLVEQSLYEPDWWKYGKQEGRYYESKAGASLFVGFDSLLYQTQSFRERYEGIDYGMPSTSLLSPYEEGELQGFSSSDALEQAQSILTAIGVDNFILANYYAMPSDAMQEKKDAYVDEMISMLKSMDDYESGTYAEEEARLSRLKEVLYEEQDELYAFYFGLTARGASIAMPTNGMRYNMISAGEESVGKVYAQVYMGRDGVEFVHVPIAMKAGESEGSSSLEVLALDDALNALVEKYSSVKSSDPVMVDKIALEYCAMPDSRSESGVVLVPCWVFRNAGDSDFAVRVNALTGVVS